MSQNPLCIKSLDWSAEGYQMWIVNSKTRTEKATDPEFMGKISVDPIDFV